MEGGVAVQFQFTINGDAAGKPLKPPKGANDVHVQWSGGRGFWIAILIFTRDGKPVDLVLAPPEADDIDIAWVRSSGTRDRISGAFWTRDGEPIGPIPVPPRCNDAHFIILPLRGGRGPRIVKAWWTQNRKPLAPIPVPKGANDFHLF